MNCSMSSNVNVWKNKYIFYPVIWNKQAAAAVETGQQRQRGVK